MKRRDSTLEAPRRCFSSSRSLQSWRGFDPTADVSPAGPGASLVGKPVDLASLGNLRSWINTDSSPLIQKSLLSVGNSKQTLKLFELPGEGQMDVGVEWPEFRTVNKVAVRFASSDKSRQATPRPFNTGRGSAHGKASGRNSRSVSWASLLQERTGFGNTHFPNSGPARSVCYSKSGVAWKWNASRCTALRNGSAAMFVSNGRIPAQNKLASRNWRSTTGMS